MFSVIFYINRSHRLLTHNLRNIFFTEQHMHVIVYSNTENINSQKILA